MTKKMRTADLTLTDTPGIRSQKVAVLNKPYDIAIRYADIPEPAENEVRIRIWWVGICGSDLEAYRGERAPEFLTAPARLGHEVAGEIDKIGSNVTGLQVGDKVACRYVWGAFAQFIVCSPFHVKVLPTAFPLEEISPVEVLPGIVHAAELARIDQTKNVLIIGQGVSGLILTQVMSLYSPKSLAVTDLYESKLALSGKYGATHTYQIANMSSRTMDAAGRDFPDGFDVVIPCLLEGDGLIDAIDCSAMCARIVLYGCIGVCKKPLDLFKVHKKRLEIYSTEPRRDIDMRRYFEDGVRLVMDGLVNTREFVSHRVLLEDIAEAFKARDAGGPDVIHVLIDCR